MSLTSTAQPVVGADRVNDVLARDEALVEVFVRHSSHFTRLRNRTMRKVMGRLVTVDDAARIASVPVNALVRDLNAALGIDTDDRAAATASASAAPLPAAGPDAGTSRTHPPDAPVVEVDVRDDLRAGREPLARIMGAVSALGEDEVLRVRAIFHPVPLLTVLGKRGFAAESQEHAPDDWSVWFWREASSDTPIVSSLASAAPIVSPRSSEASVGASSPTDDHTIWLDVRGLQPPEPLVRTLAALETLPAGHQLVQLNERVPQLLLPMLAERGFACELDESRADQVLLRIWRPA
jgi:uncharacterized protein (DUF2249 family)